MKLKIYCRVVILLLLAISLAACSGGISPIKGDKTDLNVVANVSDIPVYLEEVEYLAHNYKLDIEKKYGEGIWDSAESSEEYRAELEQNILSGMLECASFVSLCEKYGVDIDDKDTEKYVKEFINTFAGELGGKEEYIKQLEENGLTDHHLRYLMAIDASKEELRIALCREGVIDDSDETARAFIESDQFIRTLHIYIQNDEGEDVSENRKKAEKALAELEGGEKLTRLIGRYGEYDGMTTTDGYYFMRGEYEKVYEDASFALAENEYSGIVEGETGFYIIARLPKEAEYIEKNFESLKDRYLYENFEELIAAEAEKAELVFTDYGKTVDITFLGRS